jgi:aminoglycoside phosphotransferase (APT) family kinase protein
VGTRDLETAPSGIDEELGRILVRLGLCVRPEDVLATQLSGGVSADIWKVQAGQRLVCVKRARSKLKVAQEWFVSPERIAYERKWYAWVGKLIPGAAPAVLAFDDAGKLLVMEYLSPEDNRLWKSDLAAGRVDVAFTQAVASRLGTIHASTALNADLAAEFQTDHLFSALRLDPYLRHVGSVHPEIAEHLNALADSALQCKRALVHGDVSPKNILVSPHGPIFLDAECAWYGDPAFDVAFLLNHLLLKCVWVRSAAPGYLDAFEAFVSSYRAEVSWEMPDAVEARAALFLPALLLARIDGKSPVEYLDTEADRELVRRVALRLIHKPANTLLAIRDRWQKELPL